LWSWRVKSSSKNLGALSPAKGKSFLTENQREAAEEEAKDTFIRKMIELQ